MFVWPDRAHWDAVAAKAIQERLSRECDRRFDRPYELVREVHEEHDFGLHRWSRFERRIEVEVPPDIVRPGIHHAVIVL